MEIEDDHKAACPLEIAPREAIIAIEPGSIKNLKEHIVLVVNHHAFIDKVKDVSLAVLHVEGLIHDSSHYAALAHFGISEKDYLEPEI